MKILQINVYHYHKGGSETVYFNTTDILREHGHEVIHFALKWPENYDSDQKKYFPESKDTRKGISRHLVNAFNYFYNKEAERKLEELIKNERPDIAQVHLIWGQFSGSILRALKKHNIPVIFSIHDYRLVCPAYTCKNGANEICEKCNGKDFYRCITNKCTKGSYILSSMMAAEMYFRNTFINPAKHIDGLIYVSNFAKEITEKYMPGLKTKPNKVIYNLTNRIDEPKKDFGEKYFLYFGRLSFEKGVKTLIDAACDLKDIRFKIVGTGPIEDDLKHHAVSCNLNNIEFLGYKSGNELHDLVRNAYFIIVPSEWYENNPMTIIEGYAAATPVIGSRIGGIPEIIDNEKTGFLFEYGNVTQLQDIIKRANNLSKEEYLQMSNEALNFAKRHFNKDNYYPQLISFYDKVIESKH